MNYIELCAGLGGMGYGLMQAGMKCVGYAECDTKCDRCKEFTQHEIYKAKKFYTVCMKCGTQKKQPTHESFKILHDPEEMMWSAYDVRSITDDDIRLLGRERGPIQGIVAGFPCQAFSIAGKREGFNDAIRGTVFFEIVRFASILRPKFILLENVTGLLNHDKGRTFETIIGTLDELGYVGEWCVLNSSAYVPQNRERIFIVASLGGTSGRKIFPFGAENENAINVIGKLDCYNDQNNRIYGTDGIAPTLPTMQGGGQEPKVIVRWQNNVTGAVLDNKAPSLRVSEGTDIKKRPHVLEPIQYVNRIRKLTPLECFRLQSFPDEWYHKLKEHGIADSQLYKMAGNAVTSRVAYEIGKRIMNTV